MRIPLTHKGSLARRPVTVSIQKYPAGKRKAHPTFKRRTKIDQELIELFDRHEQVRRDGTAIRDYLLAVLADNNNDVEKFNDGALNRASELIDQVGPGAFYWMTDIAAQMTTLATASLNGIPTNVSVELAGQSVNAEAIIEKVVRVA
jgi:hypothetical protein